MNFRYNYFQGNPFATGIHDGGTLDERVKTQAFGTLQTDLLGRGNFYMAFAFQRSTSNTDEAVAKLFEDQLHKTTGYSSYQLLTRTIQDGAALGVSKELGYDDADVCLMHEGDKLGASAIGKLVRSRKTVAVNPFPEVMDLYP